ncbi:MAG: CARDB domain-containing protein, partial [Candidatus Bathyarchaeia archaeon]
PEETPPVQYELTISIVGNGTTVPAVGSHLYDTGTLVDLAAYADPDWKFSEWTGDLTGSVNPTAILMDGNKTVTATFVEYSLTVNIIGSGVVNRNATEPYYYGDVVELTAVAGAGWSFSGWSVDLSGSENPTTVFIDGNKVVNATFVRIECTLTINVEGSGLVNLNNSGPYYYGYVVELTAAASLGWAFSEWSADLTGSANPTTIVMDGDKTVNATFVLAEYTLTVNVEGSGSVNLNNTGPYYYGDVVELTATEDPGWIFSHWSGDLTGSTNPATITVDGNMTVTATFAQEEYTLTINLVGSGSVNLNNSGPYHYGDVVELTASPDLGWAFLDWTGDVTGSDNPTAIVVTGNKTVTATFVIAEYTLTVNINGDGTVNVNVTGPYYYGDVVELTAVPDIGWSFQDWSGDLSGSDNPTTIVMDDNKAVTATFTQNVYLLTVNVIGSGSVSLNNSGPYHYGDVVELTANGAPGWAFLSWSGDLTGSANPETITMHANHVVNATFVALAPDLVVSEILLPYPEPRLYTNKTYLIGVNVTNLGDYEALNFNVSLELFYLDGATVVYYSEQTISYLGPGASMVLSFSISPTLCGSYDLNTAVDVHDVVSELDESNNSVTVSLDVYLAGDVYGDGDVDIFDIVKMATMYGTTVGDSRYDPLCDLDVDGDIDIFDIVGAAGNYGRSS